MVFILATLSSSLVGGKVLTPADNVLFWPPFSAERPAQLLNPAQPDLTDPVQGFEPDLLQTRADLSSGVLPLWNPYVGAGHPLLASQVHAPLFPLTWLAFLLPFWSALGWIAAGKLLLAAVGAYLFCRELGLQQGPSLLGGTVYPFALYFFTWLEHPQTNVWLTLPWMFLATRRVCMRGSMPAAGLLGASAGLAWLGGHPETAAFLMAATVAYAAFLLVPVRWSARESSSSRGPLNGLAWTTTVPGRAGLVTAGLALGLGLSAIVNVPLIELLRQSAPTKRGAPAMPLSTVWSYFFPELWGMPHKAYRGGPVNFNERTAYFGALPLLLAIGGLGYRRAREQSFFAAMAVVLFATVFAVPVWPVLVRKLPDADVFALSRLLIVVTFLAAVLAAYGLQRWSTGTSEERKRMLWIMGIAAALPLLAWIPRHLDLVSSYVGPALGQLPAVRSGETSPNLFAVAAVWRWAVFSGLGVGALALTHYRRWPPLAGIILVVGLTALDLIALDRGYHPAIPLAEAVPPTPPAIRYLQDHQGDARILASTNALPANLGSRYGLRDARISIDIPYTLRYSLLWTGLWGTGGDRETYTAGIPNAQRLADVFAVRYVLLSPAEAVPGWLLPVLRTPGGTVGRNPTALPRTWIAYDWRPARGRTDALSAILASTTLMLRERPVIENVPAPSRNLAPASTVARVARDGAEKVTVQAVAKRPGYLILDDSAYPGWTALLDGHPVAWHAANGNFRAVAIPAGRHVVVFSYKPSSVAIGAIIAALSAVALLALVGLGAIFARRRRPSGSSPSPGTNAEGSNSRRGVASVGG